MPRDWTLVESDAASFDAGPGARASIGMVVLSVDRASVADCAAWMAGFPDVAIYSTRVPMSALCTPDSLAAMGDHLAEAAARLVPEGPLDALAFSCTAGLAAIGVERVHRALAGGRPGVPIVTPLEAAADGLRALGARRISILAPYHRDACELVAGHFEAAGFALDTCATFDLDGDGQMNRLTASALKDGARKARHAASDALFISCTGLRTSGIVDELERGFGAPVVTSNQATSWRCLAHAGALTRGRGEGRLFSVVPE